MPAAPPSRIASGAAPVAAPDVAATGAGVQAAPPIPVRTKAAVATAGATAATTGRATFVRPQSARAEGRAPGPHAP